MTCARCPKRLNPVVSADWHCWLCGGIVCGDCAYAVLTKCTVATVRAQVGSYYHVGRLCHGCLDPLNVMPHRKP